MFPGLGDMLRSRNQNIYSSFSRATGMSTENNSTIHMPGYVCKEIGIERGVKYCPHPYRA